MRILVLSDLHLEFGSWVPPEVDADVVVLAGDIWKRDLGLWWASEHFAPERTIVLAGNHEHYGHEYHDVVAACRASASELGCHFLENDAVDIDGVHIVGATLWTDFVLNGDGELQKRSMDVAQEMMNDFRMIEWAEGGERRRFQPLDAISSHQASRRSLETELAKSFSGPNIVVTHHLPCRRSIAKRFMGDPLNPAFCSDLSALIEESQPELWVHGHTHDSCDYRLGRTRFVCNPRGYHPDELNPAFDPAFVVEI